MAAWTNEITFKFIELYRGEPGIWNPHDPQYKDKINVNEAWERISEATNIPVADLKKKKETLMTAFRLNHRKRLASMKPGAPEKSIFTPVWMFYDPLAEFLGEVYDYKTGSSNAAEDEGSISLTSSFQEKFNPVIEIGVEKLTNEENSQPFEASSERKRRHSESLSETQGTSAHELCHTFLARAMSTLSHILTQQKSDSDDECDIYGKLIAVKLRRLSDLERLELMYEIDSLFLRKRFKTEPRDDSSPSYNI